MKHLIEVFDFPTNEDVAKLFTYTNTTRLICPVFPEDNKELQLASLEGKIILDRKHYELLLEEGYVFYIHTFGDIFNLNTDIYACVSLYNPNDKKYHWVL